MRWHWNNTCRLFLFALSSLSHHHNFVRLLLLLAILVIITTFLLLLLLLSTDTAPSIYTTYDYM